MKKMLVLMIPLMAVLAGIVSMTGCEAAKGAEGLILSPNYVDMTSDSSTRWFTVQGKNDAADSTSSSSTSTGSDTNAVSTSTITDSMALNDLSYPLSWSVSDASLGSIVASSGDTALYRKTSRSGNQIITVRDQYGNEGYATVYQ